MWRSNSNMKKFYFWDDENSEGKSVIIKELLDPTYGCYVWPSAFVLAEYIWHERDSFKDKTILEVRSILGLFVYLQHPLYHNYNS